MDKVWRQPYGRTVVIFMKRLLIFSDTHHSINSCIKIIEETKPLSAVIHAGDCVEDAEDLKSIFPNIPIHYVKGNNDYFSSAPNSLCVNCGSKKIFIVHGHEQRVKYEPSLSSLIRAGEEREADLVVFGHTHMPCTEYHGKMTIINPGSVTYSGTYAIAEIDGDVIKTRIIKI